MNETPIITQLQEILAAAKGDRSCFNRLHPSSYENALPLPKTEQEVDAFIKERIRLHHQSWIIDPLRSILHKLGAPEQEESRE